MRVLCVHFLFEFFIVGAQWDNLNPLINGWARLIAGFNPVFVKKVFKIIENVTQFDEEL